MKLADDFLVKCLNYQTYFDEIQKSNQYDFVGYRQSNYTDNQICNQLFIVKEKDYDIAIELLQGIQKKLFKENIPAPTKSIKRNWCLLFFFGK